MIRPAELKPDDDHGRFTVKKEDYRTVLVKNIPYIFTCDETDKLVCLKNQSIAIEEGFIKKVAPLEKIGEKDFDLVYDAGKRGGTVVTPGFVNTHSHIHMYLLRSAMMLDEEESLEKTIEAMGQWQKNETEENYFYASVGDITEQQKSGITTTLTHGPSFFSAEAAAKASAHNLVNAVSAVSNSRKENSPEKVEALLQEKESFHSIPAISLHYLYKSGGEILEKIKKIRDKHGALLTFHMAESRKVVDETMLRHEMNEVAILEKYGLLDNRSIASHSIHLDDADIEKLVANRVGISHLPTSNTIHKSGTFPFWKFHEKNGFDRISLGTDSVVSKNRLDLLSEAYQTRITHLYSKTVKFGSLFKMMTVNGTRVLGMDDRGKIIPGMKADLAFWKLKDRGFIPFDKENPITLVGNLITHGGRMVRDLMINGKFTIKNRRHQLIDESKMLEILQEKHAEIRNRIKNEQSDE